MICWYVLAMSPPWRRFGGASKSHSVPSCTGTCTRTRTVSRVPRTVAVIVDYSLLQTRNCYSNYSALQHVTAAHASPFEGLLVTAITACYSITALQQLQRLQWARRGSGRYAKVSPLQGLCGAIWSRPKLHTQGSTALINAKVTLALAYDARL